MPKSNWPNTHVKLLFVVGKTWWVFSPLLLDEINCTLPGMKCQGESPIKLCYFARYVVFTDIQVVKQVGLGGWHLGYGAKLYP